MKAKKPSPKRHRGIQQRYRSRHSYQREDDFYVSLDQRCGGGRRVIRSRQRD